jgi:Icc-related predicted phosphoesterase
MYKNGNEVKGMRIFATADVHGNKKIIDKLFEIESSVDLILICGDIGGKQYRFKSFNQLSKYQREDKDYLYEVLNKLKVDSRYILGNDDWFEADDNKYLSRQEQINGVQFIPFEFVAITPFNTNREVNENKLEYELSKLSANEESIIVAHMPPLGAGDLIYNGSRVGSNSIRNWIKEVKPRIWLNGHIHEDNTVTQINNTLVFNCSCNYVDNTLRGWIIDTETMDFQSIEV